MAENFIPIPGEGPKAEVDVLHYINVILSQMMTTLGRLDAKIDASASRLDVQELRNDFRTYQADTTRRLADLEQDKHDRDILKRSHAQRDEREGLTRRQKLSLVGGIGGLLAAIGTSIGTLIAVIH